MYLFPNGDSQQLNLDWLINAWRTFQTQVSSMIAPDYSNSSVYPVGSLVIYNMQLWRCTTEVQTEEEFDFLKWEKVSLADIV